MATYDRLSQLPGELVNHICRYLPARHIHNFRMTCKDIQTKADRQFVVSHFQVTQFMITRESLETLVTIVKSSRFGSRIKELQLCLVTFPDSAKMSIDGYPITANEKEHWRALQDHPHDRKENEQGDVTMEEASSGNEKNKQAAYKKALKRKRRKIYSAHQSSQFTLRKQGIDIDLLAEALHHLPSLESISLIDEINDKNPPWGARKLEDEIGIWPPTAFRWRNGYYSNYNYQGALVSEREVYLKFCSHTLALTLGAISRSQIKLKGALTIDGAVDSFVVSNKPLSRRIKPMGTPAKTFCDEMVDMLKLPFSELKTLSLHTYKREQYDDRMSVSENGAPFPWLPRYLALWPALERLSLGGARAGYEWNIFSQLTRPEYPIFPRLRHLSIQFLGLLMKDLAKFIVAHPELESFRAYNCHIIDADYRAILEAVREAPAMLSLELITNRSARGRVNGPDPLRLRGIGVPRVGIREQTPAEFQTTLDTVWTAIVYGTPVDIERQSRDF